MCGCWLSPGLLLAFSGLLLQAVHLPMSNLPAIKSESMQAPPLFDSSIADLACRSHKGKEQVEIGVGYAEYVIGLAVLLSYRAFIPQTRLEEPTAALEGDLSHLPQVASSIWKHSKEKRQSCGSERLDPLIVKGLLQN